MDINFVCAMGPPGGGRNAITPRLTRHFNYLSFAEMDEVSKKRIFSTILGSWVGVAEPGLPSRSFCWGLGAGAREWGVRLPYPNPTRACDILT